MRLYDEIAKAYLRGEDISGFSEEWYYTSSAIAGDIGKNIFTTPKDDAQLRENAAEAYNAILREADNFSPVNRPIWDVLFSDWQEIFSDISVDLIAGFPEPYDATVEYDPHGGCHIIFDIICWAKYVGQCDLTDLVRNLMTHELCHVLIHKHTPTLTEALTSSDYLTALDAITFDEGLAHLISYGAAEIGEINWDAAALQEIREKNAERMKKALAEQDAEARQKNLCDAVCGNYYEKFGCMCGMLYFAKLWQNGGIPALLKAFSEGYRGFAKKTVI